MHTYIIYHLNLIKKSDQSAIRDHISTIILVSHFWHSFSGEFNKHPIN